MRHGSHDRRVAVLHLRRWLSPRCSFNIPLHVAFFSPPSRYETGTHSHRHAGSFHRLKMCELSLFHPSGTLVDARTIALVLWTDLTTPRRLHLCGILRLRIRQTPDNWRPHIDPPVTLCCEKPPRSVAIPSLFPLWFFP